MNSIGTDDRSAQYVLNGYVCQAGIECYLVLAPYPIDHPSIKHVYRVKRLRHKPYKRKDTELLITNRTHLIRQLPWA